MATDSISKILGSEYTAQALIIINDQNTISALCCTELAGLGDSDVLRNGKGGGRLQRSDSSFLSRLLLVAAAAAPLKCGRDGAFPGKLGFYFLANSLCTLSAGSEYSQWDYLIALGLLLPRLAVEARQRRH